MTVLAETTVGQVASEHPIATRVFARHQIDFCCGGGRPIADICAAMGLDTAAILQEINVELSTADSDAPKIRLGRSLLRMRGRPTAKMPRLGGGVQLSHGFKNIIS